MGEKTVTRSCMRLFAISVVLLMASCALVVLGAQPAYALKASGGAEVHKLDYYGLYTEYDITGDGIADWIQVVPEEEEYDPRSESWSVSGVAVLVNDGHVWKKATASSEPDDWDIYLITLKNGKTVLYIATLGLGNSADVNTVLAWQSGKLKPLLNCNAICSKRYLYNSLPGAWLSKVAGNTLTFQYALGVMTTGNITFDVSYKYKSGKLVRTSSYVKPKIGGKYGKSRTALKSLTVYKNASCKSKKFVIRKGQKVKLLKMYVVGSKMALQVKVGSRTGWVKCATSQRSKLLVAPGEPPFKGLVWAG